MWERRQHAGGGLQNVGEERFGTEEKMDKKNIDWANLGFGYQETDKRFVANYRNGAWDEGELTSDANIVISECAGVLQYAQTCFEGMKAYTTEDGRIVTFRPDLNAQRMEDTCKRLEMPVFPKDRFIQAVSRMLMQNPSYWNCITEEVTRG